MDLISVSQVANCSHISALVKPFSCLIQSYKMTDTVHIDRSTVLQPAHMHIHALVKKILCRVIINTTEMQKVRKTYQSSCVIKINLLLLTSVCVHPCNIGILNC